MDESKAEETRKMNVDQIRAIMRDGIKEIPQVKGTVPMWLKWPCRAINWIMGGRLLATFILCPHCQKPVIYECRYLHARDEHPQIFADAVERQLAALRAQFYQGIGPS